MRSTMMVMFLLITGCGGEKSPAVQQAPPAPPPPTPATVPLADFRHLGFIQGNWRGQMANGSYFYERYVVTNDSIITSYDFNDSTFATPSDSGQIRWSNGQVRSGSARSSYVATIWTTDSVKFEPERAARNSFIWVRESADAWTARLQPIGSSTVTTYAMKRFGS